MKLSPYVFAEDPARKGATLILGTLPPFPVGQVWRFKSAAELDAWLIAGTESRKLAPYSELEGYNVAIVWQGVLTARPPANDEITPILQAMAQFLLSTRIEADKSYWKRYAR